LFSEDKNENNKFAKGKKGLGIMTPDELLRRLMPSLFFFSS